MMSVLPPMTNNDDDFWPTRSHIKRSGHGIGTPGRLFLNITLSNLPYLVGDILSDVAKPNDCVCLHLEVTGEENNELIFTVVVKEVLCTNIPIHGLTKQYLEPYLTSFHSMQGKPGVPIVIFFESIGSFYEEVPRSIPGC